MLLALGGGNKEIICGMSVFLIVCEIHHLHVIVKVGIRFAMVLHGVIAFVMQIEGRGKQIG